MEYVLNKLQPISKLKRENYVAEILCHDSESGVTVKKIIQMYV
jgi:hypothetical protein